MELLHLKIACYLYNQFTNYDDSYLKLSEEYTPLCLNQNEHVKALIKWLRSWGCRQFKKDDENISINSIMRWYTSKESRIPSNSESLIDYNLVENKDLIIEIFDDLKNRKAATRQQSNIHVGPVGTAKTLFALRPNLFSPWDTSIRQKFRLEENGSGYVKYLLEVQDELREIRDNLNDTDVNWHELFEYLEKKHRSYPKLIDEYYWVTITQGCDPLVIEKFLQ